MKCKECDKEMKYDLHFGMICRNKDCKRFFDYTQFHKGENNE